MPNEFVAKNGLISQNNVIVSGSVSISGSSGTLLTSNTDTLEITGSLLVTGSATFTGSVRFSSGLTGSLSGTASYANNADALDGLDSSVFTLTSSFQNYTSSVNTTTSSLNASVASLNAQSASLLSYTASTDARIASINTTTASLNASITSLNSYTSSNSANVTTLFAASASLNASVASLNSYTSSLNARTSSFATTGSNTFNGNQTITGSLNVSSNITTPGTLTAQTLVVQTITSSVDFVTGSTRFGTLTSNTHQFTGSVSASGSLNINNSVLYADGTSVGIGTSSPGYRLDVNGSGRYIFRNSSNEIMDLLLSTESANSLSKLSLLWYGNETAAVKFGRGGDATGGTLSFWTQADGGSTTERIRIAGNGNVGIGTTSPANTLHVNGSFRTGGSSTYWYTGNDTSGMYLETAGTTTATRVLRIQGINDAGNRYSAIKLQAGAEVISFETADSERMRITSGGNVLLGTTLNTTGFSRLVLNGGQNGSESGIQVNYGASTNGGFAITTLSAAGGGMAVYTYTGNVGSESYSERMRITSGGAVGIATSAPTSSYTMTVEGISADSPNILYLKRQGSPQGLFIKAGGGVTTYNSYEGNNVVYGAHVWESTKGTDTVERMRIDGSGNVGIGTTSPTDELEVRGADNGITISSLSANRPVLQFINGSTMMLKLSANGTYGAIADTTGDLMIFKGGNVGIGTTDPNYKLRVEGTGYFGGKFNIQAGALGNDFAFITQATTTFAFGSTNGRRLGIIAIPSGDGNGLQFGYDATDGTGIIAASTNASGAGLDFYTYNGSAWGNRARISKDGFLSIGTTGAATRLTVLTDASRLPASTAFAGTSVAQLTLVGSDGGLEIFSQDDNSTWGHYLTMKRFNGSTGALIAGFGFSTFTNTGNLGSNTFDRMGIHYGTNAYPQDNTELMSIKAGGNIGIGTTSPSRKLDVNGTSVFRDFTSVFAGGGNVVSNITWLSTDSGIMNIYTGGTATVQLNSSGISYFNGGNVGIGTTSPAFKLQVKSPSNGLVAQFTGDQGFDGTTQVQVVSDASIHGRNNLILTGRLDSGNDGFSFGSNCRNSLVFNTNLGGAQGATGTERYSIQVEGNSGTMYFQSSGSSAAGRTGIAFTQGSSVGIGTTSPLSKLHVSGDMRTVLTSGAGGDTLISAIAGVSNGHRILVDTSNNITYSWNTGANATAMVINNNGNVGIGTTSPVAKLSILQDISTTAEFGSFGQFTLQGTTSPSKLLSLGFNTSTDVGFIQAMVNGTSYNNLLLNARGGNVGIGTTNPINRFAVITRNNFGYYNRSEALAVFQGPQPTLLIANDGNSGGEYSELKLGNNQTDYYGYSAFIRGVQGSGINIYELQFGTANSAPASTKMTLNAAGNLGINTTSPSYTLDVNGTTRFGSVLVNSLGTGTVYSNGGTLTNTNPSDRNLKENIAPIEYGLNEVLQLDPVTFNWKNDTNINKQFGFIAQDVQEVMPDAVVEGEYLGLEKDAIYTALINAIKELKAEIDELKNK